MAAAEASLATSLPLSRFTSERAAAHARELATALMSSWRKSQSRLRITSAWSNFGCTRRAVPKAAAVPASELSSLTAHHDAHVAFGNAFIRRALASSMLGEAVGSARTTRPAPPSFFHDSRRASMNASSAFALDSLPPSSAMRLRSGS